MAIQIEKWSQFDDIIMNIVKDALLEVGEYVNNRMRAFIEQDVYVGRNEVYHDTYQFLNSVTTTPPKVSGNSAIIKVFPDPNKMQTDPENFFHGSEHWEPNDIRQYLPEILAFNLSGKIFGENQWWHNRDNYFYDTLESLSKNGELRKKFMSALRARGITCK